MSRFQPKQIFIMEVKVSRLLVEHIKVTLKYDGLFFVEVF